MSKLVVNSYNESAAFEDKGLGAPDWLLIDQDRINLLADATSDHQWIHVNADRVKKESLYQSTIARGYLTLSLLPYFWSQTVEANNIRILVNYGMDEMRSGQVVVTESRVYMVTKPYVINNLRGIRKTEADFKIEVEGQREPALEGIATFLYYFKQCAMIRLVRH